MSRYDTTEILRIADRLRDFPNPDGGNLTGYAIEILDAINRHNLEHLSSIGTRLDMVRDHLVEHYDHLPAATVAQLGQLGRDAALLEHLGQAPHEKARP